jgi:hypothetical protein
MTAIPTVFLRWLPPLLAAGVFACALSASPAAAQSGARACPDFGPATVTLEVEMPPLRRDDTKSLAQLAGVPGRRPGPAGSARGHILGLTQARYGERSKIGAVFQPIAGGTICGSVKSLAITFGFQERTVLVARELPDNSCIHREVLEHEMRHVAADEALLRDFAPLLKRRMEAVVARVGAVRARSQEQALAAIRRPLDAEMRALFREFGQKRDQAQRRIDTVTEYDRVARSCGGEVRQYLPQPRQSS